MTLLILIALSFSSTVAGMGYRHMILQPKLQQQKLIWEGRLKYIRENFHDHLFPPLETPPPGITRSVIELGMPGQRFQKLMSPSDWNRMFKAEHDMNNAVSNGNGNSPALGNKILLRFGKRALSMLKL